MRNVLLFVVSIFIQVGFCQQSISDYIRSAYTDSTYHQTAAIATKRSSFDQRMKWLDKAEIRTQTDEFDITREQYGLRLYGSKPSDIKYTKQLDGIQKDYYNQLAQAELQTAISKKYKDVYKLLKLQAEKSWITEWQSLQTKKNQYLESLFQNQLDTDVKELIQSFRKKESATVQQTELDQAEKNLIQSVGLIQIEPNQLISIEEINHLISTDFTNSIPQNEKFIKYLYDQEKIELEKQQLKNTKWDILDFVSARWQARPKDIYFSQKFAIGAGLRLPYSGTHKRDKNQFDFESFLLQNEQVMYIQAFKLKEQELKQVVVSSVKQYYLENEKLNALISKYKKETLSKSPLVSPRDILFLDETIIEWKQDISKLKMKVYEQYIDYLCHTQLISTLPLKNYLLSGIPEIK